MPRLNEKLMTFWISKQMHRDIKKYNIKVSEVCRLVLQMFINNYKKEKK
jgi:hypothetical protein